VLHRIRQVLQMLIHEILPIGRSRDTY
jgi:hypothetical protein